MNFILNIHKEYKEEYEGVIAMYKAINPAAEFELREDVKNSRDVLQTHLIALYGNEQVNKESFLKLQNLLIG
jgi:hypothetical protein